MRIKKSWWCKCVYWEIINRSVNWNQYFLLISIETFRTCIFLSRYFTMINHLVNVTFDDIQSLRNFQTHNATSSLVINPLLWIFFSLLYHNSNPSSAVPYIFIMFSMIFTSVVMSDVILLIIIYHFKEPVLINNFCN